MLLRSNPPRARQPAADPLRQVKRYQQRAQAAEKERDLHAEVGKRCDAKIWKNPTPTWKTWTTAWKTWKTWIKNHTFCMEDMDKEDMERLSKNHNFRTGRPTRPTQAALLRLVLPWKEDRIDMGSCQFVCSSFPVLGRPTRCPRRSRWRSVTRSGAAERSWVHWGEEALGWVPCGYHVTPSNTLSLYEPRA